MSVDAADTTNFFLTLDVRFTSANGSVSVILTTDGKTPRTFTVHYVPTDEMIVTNGADVYYGVGATLTKKWTMMVRDIAIDFQKGVAHRYARNKKKSPRLTVRRIDRIEFRGDGAVDNVTLSSSAHRAQFDRAADWLVRHQDSRGGWPIAVTRKLADGLLELAPGWYSAMAQGQAMSVLARAYARTRSRIYLDAALRATALFDVAASDGGVLATFLDRHPWYEEYPTTPSCFVLNGFVYSLVGLYDLKTVAPPDEARDATRLYRAGVDSLRAMLPLFDTGSGSTYDLRHFTLHGVAPNLARWDYHATHVNQLLLLTTINDDPVFETIVHRWIGYMKGKRAPHN